MVYEKSPKVYVCCGQYLATTSGTRDRKIVCPRCGQTLRITITTPKIVVVKCN